MLGVGYKTGRKDLEQRNQYAEYIAMIDWTLKLLIDGMNECMIMNHWFNVLNKRGLKSPYFSYVNWIGNMAWHFITLFSHGRH